MKSSEASRKSETLFAGAKLFLRSFNITQTLRILNSLKIVAQSFCGQNFPTMFWEKFRYNLNITQLTLIAGEGKVFNFELGTF